VKAAAGLTSSLTACAAGREQAGRAGPGVRGWRRCTAPHKLAHQLAAAVHGRRRPPGSSRVAGWPRGVAGRGGAAPVGEAGRTLPASMGMVMVMKSLRKRSSRLMTTCRGGRGGP
jgi:hypothetical protein